jgi:hypothetical protein
VALREVREASGPSDAEHDAPRATGGGVSDEIYLVTIEGDPARAAGLLALVGIQNVNYGEGSVSARLRADDGEAAVRRVRAALGDEPFAVGEVREERSTA